MFEPEKNVIAHGEAEKVYFYVILSYVEAHKVQQRILELEKA